MTKDDIDEQRIQALLAHNATMTRDKAVKIIHRWKKGRQAPSVKQADRVFRKEGLDDRRTQ